MFHPSFPENKSERAPTPSNVDHVRDLRGFMDIADRPIIIVLVFVILVLRSNN